MNLVKVGNNNNYNLYQSFVCFDHLAVLQGDLLASSGGSDVIIIENFPTTITEKVCPMLHVACLMYLISKNFKPAP